MTYEVTPNRYSAIIERVFFANFQDGMRKVPFSREELEEHARELGIKLPKNLGDIIYSFRFRTPLPASIQERAPKGETWGIRLSGKSRYEFVARRQWIVEPNIQLIQVKVPDATPGIIARYSLNDEQALLAKVRYNRLIDLFTRTTCYSLQNHLRTTVPEIGQVEPDEIYIGVDRSGVQYVFPVQAKGPRDNLSVVQIEQDFALCADKFPSLVTRPIGTQFLDKNTIVLYEFSMQDDEIRIAHEKHYRLVAASEVSETDLDGYRIQAQTDG